MHQLITPEPWRYTNPAGRWVTLRPLALSRRDWFRAQHTEAIAALDNQKTAPRHWKKTKFWRLAKPLCAEAGVTPTQWAEVVQLVAGRWFASGLVPGLIIKQNFPWAVDGDLGDVPHLPIFSALYDQGGLFRLAIDQQLEVFGVDGSEIDVETAEVMLFGRDGTPSALHQLEFYERPGDDKGTTDKGKVDNIIASVAGGLIHTEGSLANAVKALESIPYNLVHDALGVYGEAMERAREESSESGRARKERQSSSSNMRKKHPEWFDENGQFKGDQEEGTPMTANVNNLLDAFASQAMSGQLKTKSKRR